MSSVYQIHCKVNQTSTQLTLLHQQSRITVIANRIIPSNINEARQSLWLDFNVKINQNQNQNYNNNSSALEYYLRDLFNDIIARDRYIGSMLKTTIFVIQTGKNLQATIVNACFLCFLRHGVPMFKSIFQWSSLLQQSQMNQSGNNKNSKIVLDLNNPDIILQGSWKGQIPLQAKQQAKNYKQQMIKFVREYFYS